MFESTSNLFFQASAPVLFVTIKTSFSPSKSVMLLFKRTVPVILLKVAVLFLMSTVSPGEIEVPII